MWVNEECPVIFNIIQDSGHVLTALMYFHALCMVINSLFCRALKQLSAWLLKYIPPHSFFMQYVLILSQVCGKDFVSSHFSQRLLQFFSVYQHGCVHCFRNPPYPVLRVLSGVKYAQTIA